VDLSRLCCEGRRIARSAIARPRKSALPHGAVLSPDLPRDMPGIGHWGPRGANEFSRKPITGITGCCVRAASGHAAPPPRSAMKVASSHLPSTVRLGERSDVSLKHKKNDQSSSSGNLTKN
jgi:hypothetical protein